ncbi:MAG: nucleotide exchange factor GrpE [Candidatus Diapherotrites archaeon]|nr:nucleotide exchange factor GrpE [Candidatus Diapherotrites archaeon]
MFEKKKEQAKKEDPKESPEPKRITIEEAVEDNKALIETLQRLQADFENFKKREEKNREEFSKFCTASIFFDLLEIMDSFESAMQKCTPDQNEALEPLYYHLKKFLEKNNVTQFSALNEMFNPELHEVLLTGYNSYKDENIVLEEIKKGYFVFDKVLRHAQVKINQRPVKKIEEIKKELKDQLNKLSGTEASAKKEREEQKGKDAVADKLFSKESASPQNEAKENQQAKESNSQNSGNNTSQKESNLNPENGGSQNAK